MRSRSSRVRDAAAIALVAVAGAAALLAQTPTPAPGTPQFRAGVDIVIVEATVVDKKDALVTTLGPADFAVEIGGKRREIVSAELVKHETAATTARPLEPDISANVLTATGRTILIAVDHVSLLTENRGILDAAARWVAALGPGDRVGLVTLPLPGVNVEFTTSHQRVIDVLARIAPLAKPPIPFPEHNVGVWEAFRFKAGDAFVSRQVFDRECPPRGPDPNCTSRVEMQVDARTSEAQSDVVPVLRSLEATMRGLRVMPGPKHVVLLSAGWPIAEDLGSREMQSVAAQAALSNVTVHTFTGEQQGNAASRSRLSPTAAQDRNFLMSNVEMLSGMTGGRAVRLAGAGDLAFASLTEGLSGYYRLAVRAMPEDLDGKTRQIGLKVLRDGLKLSGYRKVLAANARTAPSDDPAVALRGALESTSPLTGLELRATTYLLHGTSAASRDLRVVVVGDITGGTSGPASVVAAIYTLEGKAVTAMENAVTIPPNGPAVLSVALSAPPGPYILRLAVRDVDGHLGSLERPVDARWRRFGTVESPGLVLLRGDGIAGTAPKPVFRTVSTGEQVIAQLPVASAAGQKPEVAFAVKAIDDSATPIPLVGRLGTTSTGLIVAEAVVPAGALAPGRYTLTATIAPAAGPAFGRSFVVEAVPALP